ncbi:hypothetical protein KO495_09850 [Colwellia sp. D2M02]|uniref:Uncharacterized protein n=1 Tax=Colwellia asteriadis TaxID=517723 RepID=A0ABN1L3I7_9GAMM|nr:hypothetical protein [Colwellia sp. D2M02]MBU2893622.1 hypothetical protein [Colwellia sp. D2M02]
MKKLLILIVAIAIYLHFYPNAEVTNFYNQKKEYLLDQFAELSDTKVRLKAEKIYTDLEPKMTAYSPEEIAQVKSITSSRANVKEFYHNICQTETRDIVLHLKHQKQVCQVISNYTNMF